MIIRQDHLDIARRVTEGEPLVGWTGDPRMYVQFNYLTNKYEVWRFCEDGKDRIIASHEPDHFDGRVLIALSEGDIRYRDVIGELDKHNARVEKDRSNRTHELQAGVIEVLARGARGSYLPGVDAFGVAGKSRDPNSRKAKQWHKEKNLYKSKNSKNSKKSKSEAK